MARFGVVTALVIIGLSLVGPVASASPGKGKPLSGISTALTGTWKPLGPSAIGPSFAAGGGSNGGNNSGRVRAVVQLPSGRIVAGSAGGGIWTSDDGGTNWLPRSDHAPSLAIGALAADPSNPAHLLAGTGEQGGAPDGYPGFGMLTSTDSGTTWSVQDPGGMFDGMFVGAVAIDPSSASHMFAATSGGLFVTRDGGATWAKPADVSYAPVDGYMNSVVFDPSTPATVYVGGGPLIVAKSTDSGTTWSAANGGIATPAELRPEFRSIALTISTSTLVRPAAKLYVSIGTDRAPVALYTYTTTADGAVTWSQLTAAPDYTGFKYSYFGSGSGGIEQGVYDNVVAVDPARPDHLLAGGMALVETLDGGATWTNVNRIGFFERGNNVVHADQHALAFHNDKVVFGNDGGVFLHDPAISPSSVDNLNGNLNITQIYAGFNVVNNLLLAGTQDNGSVETFASSDSPWTGIYGGDGGSSLTTPNSPSTQFIHSFGHLYVTTLSFGEPAGPVDISPNFGGDGGEGSPLALIPNIDYPKNPTVFSGGFELWRTDNPTDAKPIWKSVSSHGGRSSVSAVVVAPSNPQYVYVGFQDGTIQASEDGGSTFTTTSTQPFSEKWVTGISVDPANPHALTASFSNGNVRSTLSKPHVAQFVYPNHQPGEGSWTDITGDLPPAAVSRVVYYPGGLIAGTDRGVYDTTKPAGTSTSWSLTGGGLPGVQVQDLYVDPATGVLYAVTHGRGAWRLNLAPLTITTTALPDGTLAADYTASLTATGGDPAYTWKIASGAPPAWLKLAANTGVLTGKPTTAGTWTFTVQVTDSTTPTAHTATKTLSLTVKIGPLAITTTRLHAGRVTAQYSDSLAASGGVPSYNWTISGGSLPPGLTLNPGSGAITGPAKKAGTFNFTVKVTDKSSPTALSVTKAFSITIIPATNIPLITTVLLPPGHGDLSYSATLTATGGVQPYNWKITAGKLPPSLTLDALTGQITGVPSSFGVFTFTVTVTDDARTTATAILTIAIT